MPAASGGARSNHTIRPDEPPDHAIGRSRGGLTTKIHLICDGQGRPLSLHLTPGNVNDTTELERLLDGVRVARQVGRPRTRPDRLIADKGYSSRANRQLLRRRRIKVTIPERDDQLANRRRRGVKGGRPYRFDTMVYKARNVVERCFNKFKQWRGIATRYDKTATNYAGALTLAALFMWIAR